MLPVSRRRIYRHVELALKKLAGLIECFFLCCTPSPVQEKIRGPESIIRIHVSLSKQTGRADARAPCRLPLLSPAARHGLCCERPHNLHTYPLRHSTSSNAAAINIFRDAAP